MDAAALLAVLGDPLLLTVAAWLLFGAALAWSGFPELLAAQAERLGRGGLALAACGLGALCGPAVAVPALVPALYRLAQRGGSAPSAWMLPLLAAATCASTATLLGSAAVLSADAIARDPFDTHLRLFALLPLAAAAVLLCAGWFAWTGRRLPRRRPLGFVREPETPGRFVTELVLTPDSALAGRRADAAFPGARLLRLRRGAQAQLAPPAHAELRAGDALLVEAAPEAIQEWLHGGGVALGPSADAQGAALQRLDQATMEALVTQDSAWRGAGGADLDACARDGVVILALRRLGGAHRYQLRGLRLRCGDVLLLQGPPPALRAAVAQGRLLPLADWEPARRSTRAACGAGALALVAALVGLQAAPPLPALAAGAVGLAVVTRMPLSRWLRALDLGVLLAVAAALAAGGLVARRGWLEQPGAWLVQYVMEGDGSRMLGLLSLAAALLASVLPAPAAVVLLAALVLPQASWERLEPVPFLSALAFGASLGALWNRWDPALRVAVGAGGYRLRDLWLFGAPLVLLCAGSATLLLHWYWPAH